MSLASRTFSLLVGKRLPQYSGEIVVPSHGRIELRRDEWGVAYVDAEDEHDAWFGLGFCHGQDRMGQLEITLRLVRGTLAEVIGPEALHVDRAARAIGVRRAAERQLECFDETTRGQVSAYTAGLNAAFARGPKSHEHVLLRVHPSSWEPADVIGFGLMMCCLLPSNWDAEIARLLILCRDGSEAVEALDPAYPPGLPLTHPPLECAGLPKARFVFEDLLRLREFLGASGGSNAWAVSAERSATGRPLLASDPHLPATLPNLGYLARVKCPKFRVAGVSIAGIPAFLAGHNGYAAWGSTSASVDNTDVFLEELGPDGRSVREGDSFIPCSTRTEVIEVRGREPELLVVLTTPRGPIVARADDPEASLFEPLPFSGRANALSFSATWLRRAPTRALLRAHEARSFSDFRALNAEATGCAYSMIYADPESIGWSLALEAPRRRKGFGSLPMPGWDVDGGWEPEVIRGAELPYAENPPIGFLCTANNKLVRDDVTEVFLGHDYLDGYRQARISQELATRSDWSVDAMLALQLDVKSLPWGELRSTLLGLVPREPRAKRALELLADWDGKVSGDSRAASVYELFLAEMCRRICEQKAPRSWQFAVGQGVMKWIPGTTFNARRASFAVRLLTERPSGYFESWDEVMLDALTRTMEALERDFGLEGPTWAWGVIRKLPVLHRFGEKKPLDRIFRGVHLPGYGDGTTVNQAGFEFWNPLRHSRVTAHSRAVFDVGNFEASRFVLLGGQSGNPFSKHYMDLIPLWQRGEGVPIHWEDATVRRHATGLLVLTPEAPATSPGPTHRVL